MNLSRYATRETNSNVNIIADFPWLDWTITGIRVHDREIDLYSAELDMVVATIRTFDPYSPESSQEKLVDKLLSL